MEGDHLKITKVHISSYLSAFLSVSLYFHPSIQISICNIYPIKLIFKKDNGSKFQRNVYPLPYGFLFSSQGVK